MSLAGGMAAALENQRHTGFSMDETRQYVYTSSSNKATTADSEYENTIVQL